MESLSDEELISQFRAQGCQVGDKRIDTLFERHYQRVSLWCLRFTGNRDAAADLAQEIFLNVHRHLESFRGDAKFSTWLYTITRNQCRNKWRSGQSKPEEPMEPIIEASAVDSAPDAHTMLETSQEASRMRQLMQDALEPTEKRVNITLRGRNGFGINNSPAGLDQPEWSKSIRGQCAAQIDCGCRTIQRGTKCPQITGSRK